MNCKNFLQIGKFYHPERGGIEYCTQVTNTAMEGLCETNTTICFVNPKGNQTAASQKMQGAIIMRFPFALNINGQYLSLRYFWSALRHCRREETLIMYHSPNLLGAIPFLLRRNGNQGIIFWHSDIVNKPKISTLLANFVLRFCARNADKIIVTSKSYMYSSDILSSYHDKTHIVPIGKYDAPVKHVTSVLRKTPYFISVGRLVPYKGFKEALDAYAYLEQNFEWYIVGEGPQRNILQQIIDKRGLGGTVKLLGNISNEDLNDKWQNAEGHLMFSQSRDEAFGVVNIEAMRNGIPTIAFDIIGSGVSEIIIHGENGYLVPMRDYSHYFSYLKQISENKEYLKQNAYRIWYSEYTETKMRERLQQVCIG